MFIFSDVIERIKDEMSLEHGDKKILDKDVAKALRLTPAAFACKKNRNNLPYHDILLWCWKTKRDPKIIFFGFDYKERR